jgi:magnesium chelatase family protein
MLSRVKSAGIIGIKGITILVEVDLARGLPSFDIVGLADKAVRESRKRVKAAINNSGYKFPIKNITINLAPADIKKIGPHFDLAIATGILASSDFIHIKQINNYLILGELSLNGEVRGVKGILPMVIDASKNGIDGIIVPRENLAEARLVEDIDIIPVSNLKEVVLYFNTGQVTMEKEEQATDKKKLPHDTSLYNINFSDIKGQYEAKRALEIAASGGHNLIMVGPPGSGKTMLARRLRTILPPLSHQEKLELTKLYSIMGLIDSKSGLVNERPFRAPHHNITQSGLIGGGRIPEPGEVSLAHTGTLFLDEIPEYKRNVLELLRQPLEEGLVTIARTAMTVTFPSNFMLIAAMNPCPCGYYGDPRHECNCSVRQINNYRNKISGPLLDRIDLQIEVQSLDVKEITGKTDGECSEVIRKRVGMAYERQRDRYQNEKYSFNSQLKGKALRKYCAINYKCKMFLENAIEELGVSARGYDRILRMAKTIADLDQQDTIKSEQIAEAIQYRGLNRVLI